MHTNATNTKAIPVRFRSVIIVTSECCDWICLYIFCVCVCSWITRMPKWWSLSCVVVQYGSKPLAVENKFGGCPINGGARHDNDFWRRRSQSQNPRCWCRGERTLGVEPRPFNGNITAGARQDGSLNLKTTTGSTGSLLSCKHKIGIISQSRLAHQHSPPAAGTNGALLFLS